MIIAAAMGELPMELAMRHCRWTAGGLLHTCRGTADGQQMDRNLDCKWTADRVCVDGVSSSNFSVRDEERAQQAAGSQLQQREEVLKDASSDGNPECATCRRHFKSSW